MGANPRETGGPAQSYFLDTPLSPRYLAVLRLLTEDLAEFADADPDAATTNTAQAAAVSVVIRPNGEALLVHCQTGVVCQRSVAAAICDGGGLPYYLD